LLTATRCALRGETLKVEGRQLATLRLIRIGRNVQKHHEQISRAKMPLTAQGLWPRIARVWKYYEKCS